MISSAHCVRKPKQQTSRIKSISRRSPKYSRFSQMSSETFCCLPFLVPQLPAWIIQGGELANQRDVTGMMPVLCLLFTIWIFASGATANPSGAQFCGPHPYAKDQIDLITFRSLGKEQTCILFSLRHGTREPCTASGSTQPPKNLVHPSCRPPVENVLDLFLLLKLWLDSKPEISVDGSGKQLRSSLRTLWFGEVPIAEGHLLIRCGTAPTGGVSRKGDCWVRRYFLKSIRGNTNEPIPKKLNSNSIDV